MLQFDGIILLLGAPQAAQPPDDPGSLIGQIVPWAIVLIVLLLIAFFGLTWINRRLKAPEHMPEDVGFTLEALRKMRDRGELSEEEFLKARSHMIRQVDPHEDASGKTDEA